MRKGYDPWKRRRIIMIMISRNKIRNNECMMETRSRSDSNEPKIRGSPNLFIWHISSRQESGFG
jgi:hypothetical protein